MFGSNAFFNLLKNGKMHVQKLLLVTEGMLDSMAEGPEGVDDMPELLQDCWSHVHLVSRALAFLLSPLPLHPDLQATAMSVRQCLKYTGKSKFLGLVRDALKGDFWTKLWGEVSTRGSATLEAAPEITKLCEALEGENPSLETVAEAVKKIKAWRSTLRSGAASGVEAALLSVAKVKAEQVIKSEAKGCTASTVDCLLHALQVQDPMTPDFLQLATKLQKLRTTQAKSLATAGLKEALAGLPSSSHGHNR